MKFSKNYICILELKVLQYNRTNVLFSEVRKLTGRQYLCIDLKSFYASVECVERGLDPMTTDLVVADPEREKGTICLAVSPSLKAKGVKNRCRVFEIPEGLEYIMAPRECRSI